MLYSGELFDGWEAGRMGRIRSIFLVAISLRMPGSA